jgi:hypothetical protein
VRVAPAVGEHARAHARSFGTGVAARPRTSIACATKPGGQLARPKDAGRQSLPGVRDRSRRPLGSRTARKSGSPSTTRAARSTARQPRRGASGDACLLAGSRCDLAEPSSGSLDERHVSAATTWPPWPEPVEHRRAVGVRRPHDARRWALASDLRRPVTPPQARRMAHDRVLSSTTRSSPRSLTSWHGR